MVGAKLGEEDGIHPFSSEYRENISRFNVDCQASAGLYGLAEGAFGTAGGSGGEGDDAGQCPAASALSDAECAGAVSTCWSPGQRDTDCPSNGLCCVSRNIIFGLINTVERR